MYTYWVFKIAVLNLTLKVFLCYISMELGNIARKTS